MQSERRKAVDSLPPDERRRLDEDLERQRLLDMSGERVHVWGSDYSMFSSLGNPYEIHRGMRDRGGDEHYRPGYNTLSGVDFRVVVDRLHRRFPDERLLCLDVGCGRGYFGMDLKEYDLSRHRGSKGMTVIGTNLIPRKGVIPSVVSSVEDLNFSDARFHLVTTIQAAGLYTSRLDFMLGEMLRVAKPGGEVYFQGLPENLSRESSMVLISGFQEANRLRVLAVERASDSFWFTKP